jgi:hypothetical protein
MVKNTLSSASLALLLAWGSSYAAEPAGRVLLLQGSALAVRGTQEVPLARGVTVETGDLQLVAGTFYRRIGGSLARQHPIEDRRLQIH